MIERVCRCGRVYWPAGRQLYCAECQREEHNRQNRAWRARQLKAGAVKVYDAQAALVGEIMSTMARGRQRRLAAEAMSPLLYRYSPFAVLITG